MAIEHETPDLKTLIGEADRDSQRIFEEPQADEVIPQLERFDLDDDPDATEQETKPLDLQSSSTKSKQKTPPEESHPWVYDSHRRAASAYAGRSSSNPADKE